MSSIPQFEFRPSVSKHPAFEIGRIEEQPTLLKFSQAPRRDTFYVLFVITGGEGSYWIDFERYSLRPGAVFCVGPGQIHYWTLVERVAGWFIVFTEALYSPEKSTYTDRFPSPFSIFNWETPAASPPESTLIHKITPLIEQLHAEYQDESLALRHLAIQNTLLLLLIKLERAFSGERPFPLSAGDRLVRKFITLVNREFQQHNNVKSYADSLGVTPGHLSDVVSATTGRPPQKIIHQRITLEAKRLLIHTNAPASSIANQLSFSDPSYFGRFFKREVGLTPNQFRQQTG